MLDPRIPYFTIPELPIIPGSGTFDGITIKPFGALVALGVYLGWRVASRQARRLGFDDEVFGSFVAWVVGGGFIGGHVFDVILYHSSQVTNQPPLEAFIAIVAVWRSQASFGGFMGAIIGLYAWKRRYHVTKILPYADTVASGFPLGWAFGRTGCSVAHDHPGMLSNAWFAVKDYGGPGLPARFDLGLIEMVLTVPLALSFLYLMRKPRPFGFYLGWMATVYAPERFMLDFLRARDKARGVGDIDPRHFGLTPAQWLCVALLLIGIYFLRRAYRAQALGETPRYDEDKADETDDAPEPDAPV